MRKRHTIVGRSSSDVDVADSSRVLNRQSLHHRAARSKKAPTSINATSERKKHSASSLRLASPRNLQTSRNKKKEQRLSSPEQTKCSKKQDKIWTAHEKSLVKLLMEEVIVEQQVNLTEKKWEVISNRLASRHGFTRLKTSIKNYWSRQGRAQTGVDERRNPNPYKLITSVQNPDQRKRARQQIARSLEGKSYEDEISGNLKKSRARRRDKEEAETDDDKGFPPTKRRKNR